MTFIDSLWFWIARELAPLLVGLAIFVAIAAFVGGSVVVAHIRANRKPRA